MSWSSVDALIGHQPFDVGDTTQQHATGKIYRAKHSVYGEAELIYLLSPGFTQTPGGVCIYNLDNGQCGLASSNSKGPICVNIGTLQNGEYGWFIIHGKFYARVAAGFADNADVYLTSTGGTVDDAVVAGDRIKGMKGASAISTVDGISNVAEMELARPFVDDIAD